eukprot:jgi/Undpi1/9650/HiC_scaffold_27.g12106.m1
MGRLGLWLGFFCLVRGAASSGMPVGSFFYSTFVGDDFDVDDESESFAVVETREGGGERGGVHEQRDFQLDNVLYSAFNTIGQAQFNILQQKGLDSACWRHAASSIGADCETMSHARKQRLAVQLSNCHLQDAGRRQTRCNLKDSDERCVEEMQHNDVAFQSYTTFFHHVNAICHHLSHTMWQEQTEGLVRGLTASSLATFDRAEKSLEKQELVLRGQELASEQSQGIADGLSETSVRLTGLSQSLSQELMATMREMEKQEQLIATLLATQAMAATQASSFSDELGSAKAELASYMSAIELDRRYLILAANLCFVVTTAPPLRSSRTSLFLLVALGLLLEKTLCEGRSEGFALPVWLATGLNLATAGSFAAATWTKVFLQEEIRWLTFQACAVVLAHALVSYYIPWLAVRRLTKLLPNSISRKRSTVRCTRGFCFRYASPLSGGSKGRDRGREENQEHTTGLRSPPPLSPENSRSNDWEHEKGAQQGGDSDGKGGGGFGVTNERAGERGRGSGGGGRRGSKSGDAVEEDGLENLTRQELQSLAKKTDGLVRANLSTPRIIRGLRDCGYVSDATDHQ